MFAVHEPGVHVSTHVAKIQCEYIFCGLNPICKKQLLHALSNTPTCTTSCYLVDKAVALSSTSFYVAAALDPNVNLRAQVRAHHLLISNSTEVSWQRAVPCRETTLLGSKPTYIYLWI